MKLSRLTGIKAISATTSILIAFLFMYHYAESSTQDGTLIILFYGSLTAILIGTEACMWNYTKYEKTWIEISINCPDKCAYDIRIDGKRHRYLGPINDRLYCREGHHVVSVKYGQLEKTIDVSVTGGIQLKISFDNDIRIDLADEIVTEDDEAIKVQAKVGAIYAILCCVMTAIIILTIILNECRANM